ncbi:MAG: hypothetical protein AAF696_14575 [Bacteroidota bacterium]
MNVEKQTSPLAFIRLGLFLIASFLSPFSLSAQETVGVKDWLLAKESSLATAFDQSLLEKNFKPAWIEKLELRTETDEFSLERQEYLIRLSPSTPSIRRAQKKLNQLHQENANLYRSELQMEIAAISLKEFLDLHELDKKMKLRQELLKVLRDQQKLGNRLLQDPDYNPKKLLEIEEDVLELELEVFEDSMAYYQLLSPVIKPDLSTLISIAGIEKYISAIYQKDPEELNDPAYLLEQEMIQTELQLEKAEKNRLIDFLQFRYRGPHTDLLNERIALSMGIEIPNAGSRKAKMEELKIESWKNEQEAKMKLQLEVLEREKDVEALLMDIRAWKYAQRALKRNQANSQLIEENTAQQEWKSPELTLYLKAQEIEGRIKLSELEADIYEKYVDFLKKLGLTKDRSYMNYLLE